MTFPTGGPPAGATVAAGAPSPGQVRARRRRRLHLRGPVWLLAIVAFLAVVFVLVDRTATTVAQDKIATKLTTQPPFTGRPTVVIRGVPFLVQAVRGKYRDIEVSGPGRPVAKLGIVAMDAHLYGVHIPLSAIGGGVGSVPVDRVDVTVLVPVSRLGPALGVPGLRMTQSGGYVKMIAPIKVPLVGTVTVRATGRLTVTARQIRTTVTSVDASGGSLPAVAAAQARRALTVSLPVTTLGLDVKAAAAKVVGSTVVLTGSARKVVLH